jgi:tRNA/tmRNA/rRNA uracil-C5-methylase (TrmA/RlmC/RlmD family)
MASTKGARWVVGDIFEATVEKIAHGGHFIVRHEGAVFFVRHAIAGEKCRVVVTSTGSSFNRADVVEVLVPSHDRVVAPCEYAHRDGCGGCDFQHISMARQRALKAEVICEQFARIAKMDVSVTVEEAGSALHWRTRSNATTNSTGELGFLASRSHRVVPVKECIICVEHMNIPELATRSWKGSVRVEVATSSMGERSIALAPTQGEDRARLTEGNQILHEIVAGKTLEVSHGSFWQSHVDAPTVLTDAVLEYAQIKNGEHVLDLYGGVGLFTAVMVDVVGVDGSIDLIEGSKSATSDAARNFASNANVRITTGDVAKHLLLIKSADVVVLDPPREGAGKVVVHEISRLKPRAIVYVACDPAALARDTAYFSASRYTMDKIRAFDLFPMTHHVECVALFLPA